MAQLCLWDRLRLNARWATNPAELSPQMRQRATAPTSILQSPHFLTIDQNTCCTAQSCVLPLWRGFRVSHQHSSEVSRELEVALACFPLKSKQPGTA